MSDIIDRIGELVDQQLEQERSGYDHNVNQVKCWHCGRDWHGLPITERIAEMYARRTYDEAYSLAGDDSPVLCAGSDFIGPMPSGSTSGLYSTWGGDGTVRAHALNYARFVEHMACVVGQVTRPWQFGSAIQ